MTREPLEIDGRTLSLSNTDKLLYPDAGFRKRDLIAYYRAVAPVLLPHLADRALHLGRWPDGVGSPGWMQANARGAPPWLRTHVVTGRRGQTLTFAVIDDLPSLVWAAQIGTLELHPFQAPISAPEAPRAIVFDLDPGPGCDLRDAARAALALRDAIAPLQSFVKTSGVKGMHVLVPTNGGATFEAASRFASAIACELAARHPDWLTDQMPRALRAGRVFIDTSQNGPRKQTVAPYSLRATIVPLVSAPLAWSDLAAPQPITPARVLDRIAVHGDLFAGVLTLRQSV